MKSFVFKLLPILIAVSLIAFKTPEKRSLYYWFYYSNNFLIPLSVLEFPQGTAPYGCDEEGNYICCRAYLPIDTEIYLDGFLLKRRPKYGATIQVQSNKSQP